MALAAAVTLAVAGACNPPCDKDALACEEGGAFQIDDSCELEGPLSLTLGQGLYEFAPLEPQEEYEVHNGRQGGQHIWVALRIDEPALDYPLVRIALDAEVLDDDQCADADEPDCDGWVGVASREGVIGPELEISDDGAIEQPALLFVLATWPVELDRRVTLYAQDACGRENIAVHEMDGR